MRRIDELERENERLGRHLKWFMERVPFELVDAFMRMREEEGTHRKAAEDPNA